MTQGHNVSAGQSGHLDMTNISYAYKLPALGLVYPSPIGKLEGRFVLESSTGNDHSLFLILPASYPSFIALAFAFSQALANLFFSLYASSSMVSPFSLASFLSLVWWINFKIKASIRTRSHWGLHHRFFLCQMMHRQLPSPVVTM